MNARLDVAVRRGLLHWYEAGAKRRPTFRYWRELETSQWCDPAALETLQFARLRQLLIHAQSTCHWYRDTWADSGLDARRLAAPDDFRRWPVIDRDSIRQHGVAMRTTSSGVRLIHKATGGSTGVPLSFDLDHDSNDRHMAASHRGYGWAGAEPGTRQWYLWGVPPTSVARWRQWKGRWYDRLYRRTTESCFLLGEPTVKRFFDSLARTRPDAIVAYTGALYAFAQLLEERGLVPFSPGTIVVGAEKLHFFQREVIERVFRAPVFETYGSREFMLIGAECNRHAGLHLSVENLVVEVVDDRGQPVAPGVEGRVVVTDLTNYGMPFIRYANGDLAVAGNTEQCACGRHLPRLRAVLGRRLDVLTTPDGGRLPGEFFPHILKELRGVRRFQVVQESPDGVTIRIVAPGWSPADERWLRTEIAAVVGPAFRVAIDRVDDIPLSAAGKLQVVVNRIESAASSKRTR
ncbi:MAG: phenylacetate--CoA ligase family protein [Gemmatimonadales bacterium]